MLPSAAVMRRIVLLFLLSFACCAPAFAQSPEWCQKLPRPAYKSLERVPLSSAWFEVYQVAPGVFAIYEPHQWEEVISYLILGQKRALLLDTGMGIADITSVTSKLTKLPITVINTHTHNDHVGDNWRFQNILAMDTEFTRKNAKGSREDAQGEIVPEAICGKLPEGFDAKNYSVKPFHITSYVHDGSKIELGGRTVEVLSTPGHTPDSLCLYDAANGLLFTGDLFYLGPIYLYRPETDLVAYGHSVERLQKLAPNLKLLMPAHNTPSVAPQYLSKLLVAFRDVRAGKVQGTIQKQPPTLEYKTGDFSFLLARR